VCRLRTLRIVHCHSGQVQGMNCPALQVRQLCADMGEGLEVRAYERFAPLEVEAAGLRGGYKRVQPGDAVVAFSRATIFTIKKVPLPPWSQRGAWA
jgi:hypothetical protein